MKNVIYYLIISVLLMSCSSEAKKAEEYIRSSADYKLSPRKVSAYIERAFHGDKESARILAQYYRWYLGSKKGAMDSDIWTYIGAIYGDEKAADALAYNLKNFENITSLKGMFLRYKADLSELERKRDLFSYFVLYNYYTFSNMSLEADKFLDMLKHNKVDERLLRAYELKQGKLGLM